MGNILNPPSDSRQPFYQGIYSLFERQGGIVQLRRYRLGHTGRVVSLMEEVDAKKTLALNLDLPESTLVRIYRQMAQRALSISIPLPPPLNTKYASPEYIQQRITNHTPGALRAGTTGAAYPQLRHEAETYINLAMQVLNSDAELKSYLYSEAYSRRSGDVRAANVLLHGDNSIAAIIDPINFLLNAHSWGVDSVSPPPWGMNSPTYEIAFMITDLHVKGKYQVIQAIIDAVAEEDTNFLGVSWQDTSHVGVRALRFWTAMKCMEMAGLATFGINNPRLLGRERQYLQGLIDQYPIEAIRLLQDWRTI